MTAHYFHRQLEAGIGLPVLNAIESCASLLQERGVANAGLMATEGTVQTGLFQRALENQGIALTRPDREGQRAVTSLIYDDVKSGRQPLTFEVDAKNVKILYEKSISTSKSGVIQMRVDTSLVGTVNSYFENGWGDYQTIADVYDGSEFKHHKLRFTLMTGTFRIAAILLS